MSAIFTIESLSGLAAFSVTVESGSFTAAGRKLGLSASAVGKAVERLEQRLGLRLLNRTTRSLALTGEGDILYRYVARILEDLAEAEQELHLVNTTLRGRLKISVPTVIGRRIVLPALYDFQASFPDVTIDISLDDVKVDIIDGGYDLALRLGELEDSTLRARRIGPHTFTTCAAPGYLESRGIPQTPSDLVGHCCIHYRFPTTGRPEIWSFSGERPPKPIEPGIILNDGEGLASAALGGLGVIQAPSYLVSEDIASGRLLPILNDFSEVRGSIWLVWPAMRAQVPRVRAFIDFIAERIAKRLDSG